MPENRGCGCGFMDNDCIWIILILIVLFCCCGNNGSNRGCCQSKAKTASLKLAVFILY